MNKVDKQLRAYQAGLAKGWAYAAAVELAGGLGVIGLLTLVLWFWSR